MGCPDLISGGGGAGGVTEGKHGDLTLPLAGVGVPPGASARRAGRAASGPEGLEQPPSPAAAEHRS